MDELLNFPDEYRVNKKLGKERFIKFGNLTHGERKFLQAYLSNVELLYDIPFKDGSEFVVISTEVNLPSCQDNYFTLKYIRAIAQPFPYYSMIIMQCQGVVKFFVFGERINQHNERRMYVEDFYATPNFIVDKDSYKLWCFIEALKSSISEAHTAQELHSLWRMAISECSGGEFFARKNANLGSASLSASVLDATKIKQRIKIIDSAVSGDFMRCENDMYEKECNWPDIESYKVEKEEFWEELESADSDMYEQSDMYDGLTLNFEEYKEAQLFEEFCAAFCRPLYEEACERFSYVIPEKEWLSDYYDACNTYAKSFFNKAINSKIAHAIYTAFSDGSAVPDPDNEIFDPEELKRILYFFW